MALRCGLRHLSPNGVVVAAVLVVVPIQSCRDFLRPSSARPGNSAASDARATTHTPRGKDLLLRRHMPCTSTLRAGRGGQYPAEAARLLGRYDGTNRVGSSKNSECRRPRPRKPCDDARDRKCMSLMILRDTATMPIARLDGQMSSRKTLHVATDGVHNPCWHEHDPDPCCVAQTTSTQPGGSLQRSWTPHHRWTSLPNDPNYFSCDKPARLPPCASEVPRYRKRPDGRVRSYMADQCNQPPRKWPSDPQPGFGRGRRSPVEAILESAEPNLLWPTPRPSWPDITQVSSQLPWSRPKSSRTRSEA